MTKKIKLNLIALAALAVLGSGCGSGAVDADVANSKTNTPGSTPQPAQKSVGQSTVAIAALVSSSAHTAVKPEKTARLANIQSSIAREHSGHDHPARAPNFRAAARIIAKTAAKPSGAPRRLLSAPGAATARFGGLAARPNPSAGPVQYRGSCTVDFNAPDALSLLQTVAIGGIQYFDRVLLPWYQQCGSSSDSMVDLRPLVWNHFHLPYADPDILPCPADAYPSRIDQQGNCERAEIATEPRTRLITHQPNEVIQIRADSGSDHVRLQFDLTRIRVLGNTAVRLCYRPAGSVPVQGPVYTIDNSPNTGAMLCFARLDPGYWDLSDWVLDVDEVRVTVSNPHDSSFSFDDVDIAVRRP